MKRFQLLMFLLLLIVQWFCTPSSAPVTELRRIFERAWQFRLQENPLFATAVGEHSYDDRLPEISTEVVQRGGRFWEEILKDLERIDRTGLPSEDRVNYDIFRRQVEDQLSEIRFRQYFIPITSESGFHTSFARLPELMTLSTRRDYENYLSRLRAFPRYLDQHLSLMSEGMREGFVLPRAVLAGYETTIQPHLVSDPEKSVFYKPLLVIPQAISEADQAKLRLEARTVIVESIVPSYRRFLDFFQKQYLPNARESLAASELPNGRAYYEFLVRHHTTLELTPEQVHETGLREVARILAEMEAVKQKVGFPGNLQEFLHFLRTEPRFYARSPEELLMRAAWIAKQMDGKLPALFKTLPRLPYGVAPVPPEIAPKYTAGRYVPPPAGSRQPGFYWVNTFALESRPLYALTALTLHEAVPGHHLQNALRLELKGLPSFRKFSGFNAYGEGWGLYAERLGLEAGFYQDPYDDFGRLTYEMWRACRLVIDTGIHSKGWSRQRAMDYLASHTALSLHEIETETDRYISWPGQALAYKIGELKIRELRKRAEEALQDRFDLREFHDLILRNGPLPLDVLEDLVETWIGEARG